MVRFAGGKRAAGAAIEEDIGAGDAGADGEVVAGGIGGAALDEGELAGDVEGVAAGTGDQGDHLTAMGILDGNVAGMAEVDTGEGKAEGGEVAGPTIEGVIDGEE